jgi:hypothetical protein
MAGPDFQTYEMQIHRQHEQGKFGGTNIDWPSNDEKIYNM